MAGALRGDRGRGAPRQGAESPVSGGRPHRSPLHFLLPFFHSTPFASVFLAALSLAAAVAGCHGKDDHGASEVRFRTVEQGERSAFPVPGDQPFIALLITSQPDFDDFWRQHKAGVAPFPPTPVIDFRFETVVAVIASARATTGFRIGVDKVFLDGRAAEVEITEATPGAGCAIQPTATEPFHIVAIDGVADSLSVRRFTQAVTPCGP